MKHSKGITQSSCVVWLCAKNSVEKQQIFKMLWRTSIVLQKRQASSASSATPKHHFLKFLSLLLTQRIEKGTIRIHCDVEKSVVFGRD